MFSRFQAWLQNKWGAPKENAKAEYESALVAIFNSPLGQIVFNQWLSDVYCTVSYVGTQRCCDQAFNDGQRAFLQELLETLDRIEHGKKVSEEDEADILLR